LPGDIPSREKGKRYRSRRDLRALFLFSERGRGMNNETRELQLKLDRLADKALERGRKPDLSAINQEIKRLLEATPEEDKLDLDA
jgi:hypothetical protein